MKSILFYVSTFFVLFCISPCFASELPGIFSTPEVTTLPKSVVEFSERLRQQQSFTATFSQTKKLKILNKPLVSKGLFVFGGTSGFAWDLKTPIQSTTIITPESVIQKEPGKQPFVLNRASDPNIQEVTNLFFLLFGGEEAAITERFHVYVESSFPQNLTLGLTPKIELIEKFIRGIALSATDTINKIDIYETNGDLTSIEFSDYNMKPTQSVIESYFQ